MADELPAPFGKYFLTEKLATGGMAEIYLAKLIGPGGFEKPLVIKQIHPRLTGQRHFVDLFVAEAKTLVALAHGNIVPVYELGVIDDTYYIAMDYIDGPTLYRLTEALARRDAVMPPALGAWIAARVLEGLDYAHRKGEGVIHRDLSPRNVMLSRDGEVKLVDFGIAVTLGEPGEGEHGTAPTGSFPYMSPEQVRREPLTGQTDLFSVGVLAWEMLAGKRLFARPDAEATLAAVTGAVIERPSVVRPEVPARLDEVVMRALDRDVATRWASAGEMLAAINKYLYSLDETPGPRDVAALVARYCPPETRRLPTAAEASFLAGDDPDSEHESEAEGTPPPAAPVASGPRTAVIPRNVDGDGGEAKPRGKKRAPTRQQSFATHVDLKDMLDRATPLFGVPAVGGDDEPDEPDEPDEGDEGEQTHVSSPRLPDTAAASSGRVKVVVAEDALDLPGAPDSEQEAPRAGSSTRMRTSRDAVPPPPEQPEPPPPRRREANERPPRAPLDLKVDGRPPAQATLVLAAIGAAILGLGAIYVFKRGSVNVMRPDAMPKFDAPAYSIQPDSSHDGPQPDAAAIADAAPDATPILDARPADAAAHAPPDAAIRVPLDAAVALSIDAAGTATLKIGANPWGEIVIDGAPRGRTPKAVTVGAGHHVVQVTFGGEDPPRTKSFTVDLIAGETHDIDPDFTKP